MLNEIENNDYLKCLNKIRTKYKHKIIFGQLNINSLRNKFPLLSEIISENIDIFLVTETKIDKSFPTNQFRIPGFSMPYRLDRNQFGGGIMIYVREGIPSKLLKLETDYEGLLFELNLKKEKWLISCSYNPHVQNINRHLDLLQKSIEVIACKYENLLILGDFNCEKEKNNMPTFCESFDLTNLINSPTCYKNPDNPKCIDLMMTNFPKRFQTSMTIDTGISDFHKMTLAILKTKYEKLPPKKIKFRCYKNFDENKFQQKLNSILKNRDGDFTEKYKLVIDELEKNIPTKTKIIRGNNSPFMTKTLRKAIMRRSYLRNKYLKDRTTVNKQNYKRQRNLCVSILRQTKKDYYENIDECNVIDNKKFWNSMKPLFSNKNNTKEKVVLKEGEKFINDEKEVAEIFNNFFGNITKDLNLTKPPSTEGKFDNDFILNCISKFEEHPSIIKIKEHNNKNNFKFNFTTQEEVMKVIDSLKSNKSQNKDDIPVKIVKTYKVLFSEFIAKNINHSIRSNTFPDILKLANITPIFKKGSKSEKRNFRPVSILPIISKVFERILHTQLSEAFLEIFSEHQCGFRKNYNTQTCLLLLEETWKKANDENNIFGALLIDLSKAFDCMSHELLIAKLEAYGFHLDSIRLIGNYLRSRKQRVKIDDKFSDWHEIDTGVPQGSILGPLLFNIYICDLFFSTTNFNIANYADDTTPYATGSTWSEVKNKLELVANIIFNWLSYNQMKGNAEKCQLIVNDINENLFITLRNENIYNHRTAKILGTTFDNKLTFEPHIKNLCKISNQKLSALARICPYISLSKRRKIMNAFFKSQFSYCPLIWMFHNRSMEHKINHLHERCLRLVYQDTTSSFDDLLIANNSFTFHHTTIQLLAIEIFKAKNKLSPSFIDEIFIQNENSRETRHRPHFRSRKVRSTTHGLQSLSFLGPKIWDILPEQLRELIDLNKFKNEIKHWKPSACPCNICRPFISGIGFL